MTLYSIECIISVESKLIIEYLIKLKTNKKLKINQNGQIIYDWDL